MLHTPSADDGAQIPAHGAPRSRPTAKGTAVKRHTTPGPRGPPTAAGRPNSVQHLGRLGEAVGRLSLTTMREAVTVIRGLYRGLIRNATRTGPLPCDTIKKDLEAQLSQRLGEAQTMRKFSPHARSQIIKVAKRELRALCHQHDEGLKESRTKMVMKAKKPVGTQAKENRTGLQRKAQKQARKKKEKERQSKHRTMETTNKRTKAAREAAEANAKASSRKKAERGAKAKAEKAQKAKQAAEKKLKRQKQMTAKRAAEKSEKAKAAKPSTKAATTAPTEPRGVAKEFDSWYTAPV